MERKSEWFICAILSALLVVAGIGGIVEFLIKGYIFYGVTGFVALTAGTLVLILVFLLRPCVKNEMEKAENQDKLYKKNDWESCGCGLYISTSAKIARDEEIKRRAD